MATYHLPRHIWDLIKDHICESETSEVKCIIGESLVDQTIELRCEINLLLEIWDDIKERQLISNRLPEPPNIRELLVKDIKIFADNIRENMIDRKRNIRELLNKDIVLRFAFIEAYNNNKTRSFDPLSLDDLDLMSSKDNGIDQFENVLEGTRDLLRNEIDQLQGDICYIQECLENEIHMKEMPSMSDLQKTRLRLKEVNKQLSVTNQNPIPSIRSQSFKEFLLDSNDLFTGHPIREDDEGFRSLLSSAGSQIQATITSFPSNSFITHSPLPPASRPSFPVSNLRSGQRLLTYDPTGHVTIEDAKFLITYNSGHDDSPEVEAGRVNNDDDYRFVDYNIDNQPSSSSSSTATSSDASLASSSMMSSILSSSSSSGIFSYSNHTASLSSSSASSSSSSSGRLSSLRRRIDMMVNYRRREGGSEVGQA